MTIKIALIGKSGSGKTTILKAFLKTLKEKFSEKSILLLDNDLTCDLAQTFSLDIRKTIYGIRSGKHEYRTRIPENMSKQEFVEWALEDIVVQIDENVDIVVSWLSGVKDCRCPITGLINSAVQKLIERYDFVIVDCEYDLKYLAQLVDIDIDLALVVANPTVESLILAKRIADYSAKYAVGGQLGIVLNKVKREKSNNLTVMLNDLGIEIVGAIPFDENLEAGSLTKDSEIVNYAIKELYPRLNLPQENSL